MDHARALLAMSPSRPGPVQGSLAPDQVPAARGGTAHPFVPAGFRPEPEFRWYCVNTGHRQEILALQRLRALGLCTWLPQYAAKNKPIRPLFPRYLFTQFDASTDIWREIYSEPGVTTILGTLGERPASLPPGALAALWAQAAPNGVIYPRETLIPARQAPIPPGTAVTLASGPFGDCSGICEWSSARRVTMLLTVMGREFRVSAAREDVITA